MFSLIYFLGLTCQISFSLADYPIPVLLGHSSYKSELDKNGVKIPIGINQNEFTKLLKLNDSLERYQPPMLVFLLDKLCVEDFNNNAKIIQLIMNMSFWEYFPAVESPFEVIKNLSFYKQSTKKEVDSISHGEMVIRPINNLDEILEIYPNIKDKSDLSVGLMGKKCEIKTLERSKRALAENNNNTLNISLVVGRISFWSDQAPWIKMPSASSFKPLGLPLKSSESKGSGTEKEPLFLELTFQDNEKLKFDFVNKAGYWILKTITYIEAKDGNHSAMTTYPPIEFPHNMSYHCSENNFYSHQNVTLNLTSIQVQIDSKDGSFGETYDCVGFTTIPIWTGLFATAILGLILIWALIMIMDIRTMDRFDDSKGKTITISASE